MLTLYRMLLFFAAPFVRLWLVRRRRLGKEHPTRMGERWGYASVSRPEGLCVWVHAASVGEMNAALPIIAAVQHDYPQAHLLLTTGTLTSAQRAQALAIPHLIHQFVPVDTSAATARFVQHWQPDLAIWMESELWPNVVHCARARGTRMILANARLSERSARSWRWMRPLFLSMMNCFDAVIAASPSDAARYGALGARGVIAASSIKYDAPPPPVNPTLLDGWKQQAGHRPRWLAASTHEGEEEIILEVDAILRAQFPDLLTVIVPRHPHRGTAVEALCVQQNLRASCMSKGEVINAQTQTLIGDVMGEMGSFFSFCSVVLMGGSLVPQGGHNPIEPAQLGCAIVSGPHLFHFADMASAWQAEGALVVADDARGVAAQVQHWLEHEDKRLQAAACALHAVEARRGALTLVMHQVGLHLPSASERKAAS